MFKFKKILDESNEKTKSDHFAVKFKKKDSQSISKNRLNLMQYTACLVFNPDTVKKTLRSSLSARRWVHGPSDSMTVQN